MLRIPVSTYRLQFNKNFKFSNAADIITYLSDLGITDLYSSPLFEAKPGSMHGYDVINHGNLNPECGSESDFKNLTSILKKHNMGLILDLVPNHMAVDHSGNRWWNTILENGPSSPYSDFFDINWEPPVPDLLNKVLLPFLGDSYGKILEEQEISLLYENGEFFIQCYSLKLPIAPKSYLSILTPVLEKIKLDRKESDPLLMELESILTALGYLPERVEREEEKIRERQREKEVIKKRISLLYEQDPIFAETLNGYIRKVNGEKGVSESFNALETLLNEQAFRLCYWGVAADEINYRRFFDINSLGAIRVEKPEVFNAVHQLAFDLADQGDATGFRIDHVDGLFDPAIYLQNLQKGSPGFSSSLSDKLFYVVVEKILTAREKLNQKWPIYGTTGYDFLNYSNKLFVSLDGLGRLTHSYLNFTGIYGNFAFHAATSKKLFLLTQMASELYMLTIRLHKIARQNRWSRDFTLESLRFALREVMAYFPVYRTYKNEKDPYTREEKIYIKQAIHQAVESNPAVSPIIFNFIEKILLLEQPFGSPENLEHLDFVMRFQQLTGPVMAKGLEDTAFYRYYPLLSLNEVGGDPGKIEIAPLDFHDWNQHKVKVFPHSFNATSTHDTKRSEDSRARLNVLSEIPEEWNDILARFHSLNLPKKYWINGQEVPDKNEEYLFYQSLLCIWPFNPPDHRTHQNLIVRVQDFMVKALREAKIHTSWINPDESYEANVKNYISRCLKKSSQNNFLTLFQKFTKKIAESGFINALSQVLLKMTAPGVPDFYQGTELWNFSLVDPDNRRSIDFSKRREVLEEIKKIDSLNSIDLVKKLTTHLEDGKIKMYLIYKTLNFRKSHVELFQKGDYIPIKAIGPARDHVFAFMRTYKEKRLIAAVPRFFTLLEKKKKADPLCLEKTSLILPIKVSSPWTHLYTGEKVKKLTLFALFRHFPVSLLY